jgi:hypothetical protein
MTQLTIAGVAGGVGTTVVATVLDAIDAGRETEGADVLVARNDYRCAKALLELARPGQVVIVLIEPGRALRIEDFVDVLQPYKTGIEVHAIDCSVSVARADDAGLLTTNVGAAARFAARLHTATAERRRRHRAMEEV